MSQSKQGNVEFALNWKSADATHTERVYIPRVNYWRDYCPGQIADSLSSAVSGETVFEEFAPGTLVEPYNKNRVYRYPKLKLGLKKLAEKGIGFDIGRVYPRSALAGVGFTSGDFRPFRVVENNDDYIIIDINHPLHEFSLKVSATILETLTDRYERGGFSNDVIAALTDHGPGIQAPLAGRETDFFSRTPFAREDETPDDVFYSQPRKVDHIDSVARGLLSSLYGRFVKPESNILDLMAGWSSHFPEAKANAEITGLGMNTDEMQENSALSDHVTQDLNQNGKLPFKNDHFDLAVCSLSVEYLVEPVPVFKEIGRVLKPGSPFIVTFSDRWFPEKVISIWKECHPFERMALVLKFFKKADSFESFHTETIRGYSRPEADLYFGQRKKSDPLFAVWGFAKK